jgi:hypothetical protein
MSIATAVMPSSCAGVRVGQRCLKRRRACTPSDFNAELGRLPDVSLNELIRP